MIRLTRRYRFCASHRLHSDALSDEENSAIYGKCNNPYGHGHDYMLEVTVAGEVNPNTGQVVHLPSLDELIDRVVLRPLDHRDLNSEAPEFAALVPTSENLALVIERRLKDNWTNQFNGIGPLLDNVHLQETRRNRFDLRP